MKITVVIPCRNEHLFIEECIHAIYKCDLPDTASIQVFVVDGMSDDGTRIKVENLKAEYSSLQFIDNVKQLTPFAFNLGIYAGGKVDFVQIVGARHILSTNYLMNAINMLNNNNEVWCVGGRIINEYINETGRVISNAMSTTFGMGLGNFRTLSKSGFTDTVTSPMYPYWVFEKIGFFDENLIRNQDDDFNFRVTNAGGKIYYDHEISLKYYVRGNFKGLWKQFFQYGYWKVYVNRKHKAVTTLRQLVPPLFVVYLFLLLFSPLFNYLFAGVVGLPFTAYILLALYFSYQASKEDAKIQFIEILKTYPILHISYGLGYLKGLFTFFVLKNDPSEKQKELSR